jgi:NTP pyrophosphatase (non-canonical NTP hydrolase)
VDNNGQPKYEWQGFREEFKDRLGLLACLIQISRDKKKEKLERKARKEAKKQAQG